MNQINDHTSNRTSNAAKPESLQPSQSATAQRRRAARRLLPAETVYMIALAAFSVLAGFAYFYPYFAWDLAITRLVQSIPGLLGLMQVVSLPGNWLVPHVLTALTCIIFLFFRRRSEAAGLLLSASGSGIVNALLKFLIARPRPTADLVQIFQIIGGRSFPSGHVMFYVCYFGFLFFVAYAILNRQSQARRILLALAALPVLLVGVSRVYLGAHWASDTIGAYFIGGVWLAFSLEMYRRWKARSTFHPEVLAEER